MRTVVFKPRFNAWRDAARRLLTENVHPDKVLWMPSTDGQGTLFPDESEQDDLGKGVAASRVAVDTVGGTQPSLRISRDYLQLAEAISCYRDPARWRILYRVAWRLTHGEAALLQLSTDRDVTQMVRMERAVRRDIHKMKAFVRFRRVVDERGEDRYIAWFRPDHEIVERIAPFFVRRFMSMDWTILTPDCSIHWDRTALTFSQGMPRSAAPNDDELETLWRTYYASIFNPARVKAKAMRAEMPKKYWFNLPEASLIPELMQSARRRTEIMLQQHSSKKFS